MKIPPLFISEDSTPFGDNKHLSKNGFSNLENSKYINYQKRPEGYAFFEPGQDTMFIIPIQDLDENLPQQAKAQLSKEHLQIYNKIVSLRSKLYALKEKLDSKNLKVSLYDVNPLSDGYYAQYHKTDLAGGIAHSVTNAGVYDGHFSCGSLVQKYVVSNGRIELKGTPYSPQVP